MTTKSPQRLAEMVATAFETLTPERLYDLNDMANAVHHEGNESLWKLRGYARDEHDLKVCIVQPGFMRAGAGNAIAEYRHEQKLILLSEDLRGDELTYALAHELGHHVHYLTGDNAYGKRLDMLQRYPGNTLTERVRQMPLSERIYFYLNEVHAFNNARKILQVLRIELDPKIMSKVRRSAYRAYRIDFKLGKEVAASPTSSDIIGKLEEMLRSLRGVQA